jgi:hypothetical protein
MILGDTSGNSLDGVRRILGVSRRRSFGSRRTGTRVGADAEMLKTLPLRRRCRSATSRGARGRAEVRSHSHSGGVCQSGRGQGMVGNAKDPY